MQFSNPLSRLNQQAPIPTIPERSLAKYLENRPPAERIDAAPRTATARVAEAALIASAVNSERETHSTWGWAHDPALLVGVGVCFIVWLASTKLIRR